MRFIRSIRQCLLPEVQAELSSEAAVGVTIGNFDGMHIGHQVLFTELSNRLQESAKHRAVRPISVLMTFAPHPQVVLSGKSGAECDRDQRYWSLTSLSRKIQLAEQFGFDYFFVLKFTRQLASLSPESFVEQYLVSALHVEQVVVGHDWGFGKDRQGSASTLRDMGKQNGFDVFMVPPIILDGERVSSSMVKEALKAGDFRRLRTLLGRGFEFAGKVRCGAKRGRELGFPTANLKPKRELLPPAGVYVSLVRLGEKTVRGVTNIGVRPTFDGTPEPLVETHLLDGENYNLYGRRISVEFVERIRSEKKFSSVEALKEQIAEDVLESKKILTSYLRYSGKEASDDL